MKSNFKHYSAALDFLYQQLPMYQKIGGKAFKPGLDNIRRFLSEIGNPQDQLQTIHVAGTNGKGSTSHMLTAVLQAAGLKVGLYTSPHYKDFRERAKINGQLVPESYVLDFVNRHYDTIQQIQPSYFELTVALAFAFFADEQVDMAVIETGLGGRLDSTNVVQPLLSVITNIGYDHQDVLGDTLAEIAAEKAGIIKPDTPVVVGHTHPETEPVFRAFAKKQNANLVFADQVYRAEIIGVEEDKNLLHIFRKGQSYAKHFVLDALGTYQAQNLQTTLAAVDNLRNNIDITPAMVVDGLANLKALTYFIGRWQRLGTDPAIIADSGHNKEGFAEAMRHLQKQQFRQLHLVIGFSTGKDHRELLTLLPRSANFYWTKPSVPRALALKDLQALVKTYDLPGVYFGSVEQAITAARAAAAPQDLIFIGGSSFTVADALNLTY